MRYLICVLLCSIVFGGIDFDPSNEYVDMGDVAAVDTASALTVSAWVYHNSITADNAIVSKTASGSDPGFKLWRDDSAFFSGRTDTYTISYQESDGAGGTFAVVESAQDAAANIGVWTHVVATYQENIANGLRLYINGDEDTNSPVSTVGVDDIDAGAVSLRIGILDDDTRDFDGIIDEVAIWSTALSADEVKALCSRVRGMPYQIQYNNLIGYWRLMDNPSTTSISGDNVVDWSGNGNDGTGTGSGTWAGSQNLTNL
jgi:hypothetical protein